MALLNVLALAMGKAPATLDVQPDYTRSVLAVMEDTTRKLIRHVRNLGIFHQVQDRSVVSYDWEKRAPATRGVPSCWYRPQPQDAVAVFTR
jgi:hypothetical protein